MRPDLDALTALIDKATPGPWRVDCVGEDEEMVMRTIHGKPSAGGSEVCIVTTGSYDDATEAKNAALIVAAVNALPALLAYVRELERERDDAMYDVGQAADKAALAMRERCAQACDPPICGSQGFAGPSCCILPPGHEGAHKYGEPRARTPKECAAEIRALEP